MTNTNISRAPDWEERLAVYLDRVHHEPFKWGTHDCALFAAGALNAMTGVDPAADWRGTYDSKVTAAEALAKHQGTLLKTAVHWLGRPKHPSLAHRGDIVMRDRTTLGICVGLYSWFVGEEHGEEGLVAIPTASCSKAFTIPYSEEGPTTE